jgi:hypothetical protein
MSKRVKVTVDQDGKLQHPIGKPFMLIFDSREEQKAKNHEISWQEPHIQPLEIDKGNFHEEQSIEPPGYKLNPVGGWK